MRKRRYIGIVRTAGRFMRSGRRAGMRTKGTPTVISQENARIVVNGIRLMFSHYRGAPGTCQRIKSDMGYIPSSDDERISGVYQS